MLYFDRGYESSQGYFPLDYVSAGSRMKSRLPLLHFGKNISTQKHPVRRSEVAVHPRNPDKNDGNLMVYQSQYVRNLQQKLEMLEVEMDDLYPLVSQSFKCLGLRRPSQAFSFF
ncbi:uncharacterized protein LOC143253699 [Tachypleus tridentatus]|uniref:uncharacterized protein LOC143253699 n=1 Tax=Tachypleus tridentatus TaxID=6853 RepID=UPI003FD04A23